SDAEEEDILTCKPLWETSDLKLPKFNSEENDSESATELQDGKLTSCGQHKDTK
ncbi:hypothetical protein L9F63_009319, partial [Diploptera punctata]